MDQPPGSAGMGRGSTSLTSRIDGASSKADAVAVQPEVGVTEGLELLDEVVKLKKGAA